jgi:hypothetical protein
MVILISVDCLFRSLIAQGRVDIIHHLERQYNASTVILITALSTSALFKVGTYR